MNSSQSQAGFAQAAIAGSGSIQGLAGSVSNCYYPSPYGYYNWYPYNQSFPYDEINKLRTEIAVLRALLDERTKK